MAAAGGDVGERGVAGEGKAGGTGRGASRCYVTVRAGQLSARCPSGGICISIDLCSVCGSAIHPNI